MAATEEIRFKRMRAEYESVRDAQDGVLDRVDTYEAALLGLTQMVAANSERMKRVENKMDAIIAHFEVPYKPDMGFLKDRPSNGQG